METWDRLPAMGCARALRLRRAAVLVLSTGFVDSGRHSQRDISLDHRGQRLHMGRAGGSGSFHVSAGAKVV